MKNFFGVLTLGVALLSSAMTVPAMAAPQSPTTSSTARVAQNDGTTVTHPVHVSQTNPGHMLYSPNPPAHTRPIHMRLGENGQHVYYNH